MNKDEKILIKYRIERSYQSFEEANYCFQGDMFNLTINRLYYSCFYIVTALLICENFYPKTHKGTRNLFNQQFILTKKIIEELSEHYTKLFDLRQECDYKDFVEYNREDVEPLIEKTKDFLKVIE